MHAPRVRSRVLALTASVAAALALVPGAAQAEPDPLDQLAPGVAREVKEILSDAPRTFDKIVITTRTSPDAAPTFTTKTVDDRTDAVEEIAKALGKDDVVGVDAEQPVKLAATRDTYNQYQWSIPRTGVGTAWKYSVGRGVKVAVIDTGVYPSPEFKGRYLRGYDFIAPGTPANDPNGHGTHVAGVIPAAKNTNRGIAGFAPSSIVMPVRVLDADGSGTSTDLAKGITWAARNGAHVINLSLTVPPNSATAEAIRYAQNHNVVVVAAAGNTACPLFGTNVTTYPAAYPGVIGVGATDRQNRVASFSSCGSWVDISAPGVDIISLSSPFSNISECPRSRSWCYLSGTSMASPHVAAAAAMVVARVGRTRYEYGAVSRRVLAAVNDIDEGGRDVYSGNGLLYLPKLF